MTESEDLPDWTKESHLTVTVVDEDPAEVTVIQSDETKLKAVVTIAEGTTLEVIQDTAVDLKAQVLQKEKDRTITGNVNVIAHPTGELTEKGEGVVTQSHHYEVIVSRLVKDGWKYSLGKLEIPMVNAHWIQIEVDGNVVKTYYAGAEDTFVMFYLYDEVTFIGNGFKRVQVKAKAEDVGEVLYGYMSGEEV